MAVYKQIKSNDFKEIAAIWKNDVITTTIYKAQSESSLRKLIMNQYFDSKGSVTVFLNHKMIGYGVAYKTSDNPTVPGFIGVIVVCRSYRRLGYGTQILHLLESYLQSTGKTFIRQYFAAPLNFEWMIPNTNHYHSGTPAIPLNSAIYFLLKNNGYYEDGQLDGYYLEHIHINKADSSTTNDDFAIELYQPNKHKGLIDFFDRIENNSWKQTALHNLSLREPKDMLVVVKNERIVGWTGPLYVTDDFKGSFGGIGIDPLERGHGLGKMLFLKLCETLKEMGAIYMTLFTGSDNIAKYIYQDAGFHKVASFTIMRKELN